ncbi:MAG: hypothetical protein ACYDD1_20735 [Caulobacteraceae bacterium]
MIPADMIHELLDAHGFDYERKVDAITDYAPHESRIYNLRFRNIVFLARKT